MTDMCREAPPALLLEGIALFNAGAYFEQHETLETLWRAESRPVRRLYQGVLQIGVAFHHVRRGNYHGVVVMFERGLRNVQPFRPVCQAVDVEGLVRDTQVAQRAILALGRERLLEFDWRLAPRVRLISYRE